MKEIYHLSTGYKVLKSYTLFGFRQFYRDIIIRGEENIPKDSKSAIIFAPNHLNALMDALAVAHIMPKPNTVAYLARADLFAKKQMAKVLYYTKILPAFRMRDGMENLGKNQGSFQLCVDALRHNQAICIMPEGGQGEERKIRPLVKGIFRLAFDAQIEFGSEKDVKIVPIGLYQEDLIKTGKELIINIGKPISINDYMESYRENAPQTINTLRDELHKSLSALTLDLASSKHYTVFENCVEIMAEELEEQGTKSKDVYFEKFLLKQKTAKSLVKLEQNDPGKLEDLHRLTHEYNRTRQKLRFKNNVFSKQKVDSAGLAQFMALLIASPVAIFGLITNFLAHFVPVWLRKALKVDYDGFFSSVQFALGILLIPLIYLLQTLAFHFLFSTGWEITLIFLILQYYTRLFSLRWYSRLVRLHHKARFDRLIQAEAEESTAIYKLISLRNKIIKIIQTAY